MGRPAFFGSEFAPYEAVFKAIRARCEAPVAKPVAAAMRGESNILPFGSPGNAGVV